MYRQILMRLLKIQREMYVMLFYVLKKDEEFLRSEFKSRSSMKVLDSRFISLY